MTLPAPFAPRQTDLAAHRAELDDIAHGLVTDARAANTIHQYDRDWRAFAAWCDERGETPMPATPDTLRRYIAALTLRDLRPATIERYVASVSVYHRTAGVPNPAASEIIRLELQGVRNRAADLPSLRKAPLTATLLREAFANMDPDNPVDVRDRALILLAFAGFFRRSEVAALDLERITDDPDGLVVHLGKTKTDQEGKGALIGIRKGSSPDTCPVHAWNAWHGVLLAHRIVAGPAFRDVTPRGKIADRAMAPRTVANIIKRRVGATGLDPAQFAGHSARRGGATASIRAGADERKVRRQGRWKSNAFEVYVDEGQIFDGNASGFLGL